MDKLSDYLAKELKSRGWSMRELSRRSGISHAQVSNVVNEGSNAGYEFCIAVAKALNMDPGTLLNMAGFTDAIPGPVPDEREIVRLFRRLSSQMRNLALTTLSAWTGNERSTVAAEQRTSYSSNPEPHTLSEHLAYQIASELETMHPEDQQAVLELMQHLRGERNETPRAQLDTHT